MPRKVSCEPSEPLSQCISEGSKVDVTVAKGVVDVAELNATGTPAQPKRLTRGTSRFSLGRLKAGEMTRVENGSSHIDVQQLAETELQRKMAWQDGYLAFSGESLMEVVEQVNRYSQVRLEVGDANLGSVAIGGRFRIGDLDAVLEYLQPTSASGPCWVGEHEIQLESDPRG